MKHFALPFVNHKPLHNKSLHRVRCDRISDFCGFGVPLYEDQGKRTRLLDWAERKGDAGLRSFQEEYNRRSVDGLPGSQKPEV